MSNGGKVWPEGLTDLEAIERLEGLLLMACEGNKDLSNGREYKALRSVLIGRDDLRDVVPRYIRTQRDLAAFWAYIQEQSAQYKPRRKHVRDTFAPLYDRVEGRTAAPTDTSKWTGRRSASQQAKVVIALGYDALTAIEVLLNEQQHGLHNGGPVEPEREEAIEKLKRLHDEIGLLLRLAEEGNSLDGQLAKVRGAMRSALRWTASPIGFSLSTVPLTGASLAIGVGVMQIVEAICKGQGTAFGVAAMGAHVAGAAVAAAKDKG